MEYILLTETLNLSLCKIFCIKFVKNFYYEKLLSKNFLQLKNFLISKFFFNYQKNFLLSKKFLVSKKLFKYQKKFLNIKKM